MTWKMAMLCKRLYFRCLSVTHNTRAFVYTTFNEGDLNYFRLVMRHPSRELLRKFLHVNDTHLSKRSFDITVLAILIPCDVVSFPVLL